MTLNGLFCADVPLSNYSLTRGLYGWKQGGMPYHKNGHLLYK